jgi:O-antigen biosynthesis protein
MSNSLVSIIIPAHNKWEYTKNCIISIQKTTIYQPYEILVGDDESTDETLNLNSYFPDVRVIRHPRNLGFLLNCNATAKHAKGDFLLFLNNDTTHYTGWLTNLVETFKNYPKTGIAGPRILSETGKLQEAGGIVWKDATGWNYGRGDDPNKPEYTYVKEVDYITGACIITPRALWEELGGFDERYSPAYYEDTDYAFAIREKGYKAMYQPKSVIVHLEGVSHGRNVNSGVKRYQVINHGKFIDKWRPTLETQHLQNGDVFHARDKSKNKKLLLMIDWAVPTYDKDAGSRTTYQYIKLLLDLGLNVKFIGANFANRHQTEPYISGFEQMGVEVLSGPYYNTNVLESWLQIHGQNVDYVYLNRPNVTPQFLPLIKKYAQKAKTIYYGHDLHFLRDLRRYDLEKDKQYLTTSANWKTIEFDIMKSVDVVFSLSEYEKAIIKENVPSADVKLIPPFIFDSFGNGVTDFEDREGIMFIGGFYHTPNVDAMLWFTREVFPKIQKEIPAIKLYIVGSNPPKQILSLHNSVNIIVKGYVTDAELDQLYSKIRLVVAPLRYGAGVKGKIVEAMNKGIPVVATSIGKEGLQEIGDLITAADLPIDFSTKVVELYKDTALLTKLSKESIDYTKKFFSKEKATEILEDVLYKDNPQPIIDIIKDRTSGYLDPLGITIIGYLNLSKNNPEQPLNTMFETLDSLGEEIIFEIVMTDVASLKLPTFTNIRIIKTELPTSNILNWAKSNLFWDMVVLPSAPEDFTEYMCCSMLGIPSICSTAYKELVADKDNGILTDDYAYGVKQLLIDKYLRISIIQNLNVNKIIKNNLGLLKRKLL